MTIDYGRNVRDTLSCEGKSGIQNAAAMPRAMVTMSGILRIGVPEKSERLRSLMVRTQRSILRDVLIFGRTVDQNPLLGQTCTEGLNFVIHIGDGWGEPVEACTPS